MTLLSPLTLVLMPGALPVAGKPDKSQVGTTADFASACFIMTCATKCVISWKGETSGGPVIPAGMCWELFDAALQRLLAQDRLLGLLLVPSDVSGVLCPYLAWAAEHTARRRRLRDLGYL